MKKFILSAGLMLAAAVTFAGNPKGETKDANAAESKTNEVTTKWFHFVGNATTSDIDDPSMYREEATPQCSTTPNTYRCDILIQTDPNDPSQPDLSQLPVQERKRANP